MRRITINRARTCLYRKMRPCIDWFSDRAPLLPFRYWLGCIINTSGYDFRKGQGERDQIISGERSQLGPTA